MIKSHQKKVQSPTETKEEKERLLKKIRENAVCIPLKKNVSLTLKENKIRLEKMIDYYMIRACDYEKEHGCLLKNDDIPTFNKTNIQPLPCPNRIETLPPRPAKDKPFAPQKIIAAPIVARKVGGISSTSSTPAKVMQDDKPKPKRVVKKKTTKEVEEVKE